MPEPSSSAGVSLTVIAVALLGPMAGPYALIAFVALAGAMWPLSATPTAPREGAWLLLRCTLTAVLLTGFLSGLLERFWSIPRIEALAPLALVIGALGNGWRPVFESVAGVLKSLLAKAGGPQ